MAGTPGLYAALGDSVPGRQLVDGLMDISNVEVLFHTAADYLPEGIFQLGLNDKDQIPETCTPGIKQGKVHNNVALLVNGSNLLQSTKSAAHAGCHND